ncbi:MAG: hypothetical protein NTY50_00815 [Methylobacter sp.]|nr:hypothetical protein [Methylobacter sp.]
MYKAMQRLTGAILFIFLSAPTVGFAQETPNCGDDKVKEWAIEKMMELAKIPPDPNVTTSLSAIRTEAKDDAIKKVFCIANMDIVKNNTNQHGTVKNIEYSAQTTEDGLLYMEIPRQ